MESHISRKTSEMWGTRPFVCPQELYFGAQQSAGQLKPALVARSFSADCFVRPEDEDLKPLPDELATRKLPALNKDQKSGFPNLYDAVFSSCSARSQSCSGEPSGQPRSAQYFSARRAISSREGAAAGVCFLAAGFRFLEVPFAASTLLVVIRVSLNLVESPINPSGDIFMIRRRASSCQLLS